VHRHLSEYNKSHLAIARALRKTMTDAERKLWSLLRNNQLQYKFRRQVPVGNYVLDFYCPKAKLNIELDGGQHYTEKGMKQDNERDQYLKKQEIEVLRFPDNEIFQNEDGVLNMIYTRIKNRTKYETPS
jgi:very-short-patch-repair endonuclease